MDTVFTILIILIVLGTPAVVTLIAAKILPPKRWRWSVTVGAAIIPLLFLALAVVFEAWGDIVVIWIFLAIIQMPFSLLTSYFTARRVAKVPAV